jgi:hypothetical protein
LLAFVKANKERKMVEKTATGEQGNAGIMAKVG